MKRSKKEIRPAAELGRETSRLPDAGSPAPAESPPPEKRKPSLVRKSDEIRRAESALRISEERFRQIAENIADVIWIMDLNLRYSYISPSVVTLRGWSAEETMNQTLEDVVAPSSLGLVRRAFSEELARELRGGALRRVRTLEVELMCQDGSTVWTELRMSFLHDDNGEPSGVIGVSRDITDRLRIQSVMREREEEFRALSAAAQDAIIVMDNDGLITYWSEGAIRIFGYLPDEALGKDVHGLLAPAAYMQKIQTVFPQWRLSGQGAAVGRTVELVGLRKGGKEFPAEISLSSTQIKGRWNAIAIIRDITKRRREEEELRRTNEKLSVLVKELEERGVRNAILSETREFLQACLTTEEIGPVIVRLMTSLFPDTAGALFLLSASRTDLEAAVRWGNLPGNSDDGTFTPDACWGLRRGRVHFVEDAASGLVCPHLKPAPAGSYACMPLTAKGDVLGLLHVRSLEETAPGGGRGMIAVLKDISATLSEMLSLSISNLRLRETLSIQSIRDPLTGLFNRRYMEECLEREISRAARKQESIGIVMIDVDHFKSFNDLHGHPAGDAALADLAKFFKKELRGGDIVCRYGGEEFTFILPDCTPEDAGKRARYLISEARKLRIHYGDRALGPITLSAGVAAYPLHGEKPEELIRAVDAALYKAKKEGRDRIVMAA